MAAQSFKVSVIGRGDGPYGAAYLLPAPFTAFEHAARDAELLPNPAGVGMRFWLNRARFFWGAALAVVAVTLPDASLGGIGSAVARIAILDPNRPTEQITGKAAAASRTPNYVPLPARDAIFPTLPRRRETATATAAAFKAEVAREILQSGSQRFDLAFAGAARPSLEAAIVTRDAGLSAPKPVVAHAALTASFYVSKIDGGAGLAPAHNEVVGVHDIFNPREPDPQLSQPVDNSAFETAFAALSDIADAKRNLVDRAASVVADEPEPYSSREPFAVVVPSRVSEPRLGALTVIETALVQKTSLPARVNGVLTGSVDFRQGDGTMAIRLRSVAGILRDRFAANELDDLMAGKAIDAYVTLEQLQAVGVPIRYNPAYDEVEFGIDYDDAPQSDKVQIEQVGVATTVDERAMIDQIRLLKATGKWGGSSPATTPITRDR